MIWLKRITLALISAVIVLYLVIWALSPVMVRWLANDALQDFGLQLTETSSVRLNPFISALSISDLALISDQGLEPAILEQLYLKYRLRALVTKTVYVEEISITGLHAKVSQTPDQLWVAGFAVPGASGESDASQTPEASGDDSASELKISVPSIEIRDSVIDLDYLGNRHSLVLEQVSVLDARYDPMGAGVEIQGDLALDQAQVRVETKALYQTENLAQNLPEDLSVALKLSVDKFALDRYQYLAPEELALELGGELALAAQATLALSGSELQVTSDSLEITLDKLSAQAQQSHSVELDQFAFAVNDLQLDLDQSQPAASVGEQVTLQAQLGLAVESAALSSEADQLYQASFARLESAPASLTYKDGTADVTLAQFTIDTLALAAPQQGSAAQIQQLTLADLALSLVDQSPTLGLGQLSLADIRLNKPASDDQGSLPNLVQLDSLVLDQLAATPERLALAAINFGGGMVHAHIAADGNLANFGLPQADVDAPVASEADGQAQTNAPDGGGQVYFAIDAINLSAPIKMSVLDQSKSPKVDKSVELTELSVTNIDSQHADSTAEFHLTLQDQQFFRLKASGDAQPFADKINGQFNADISEFSLPEISPYIGSVLDLEFKTGLLDTQIDGTINNDDLDIVTKIVIRGADFSASQAPQDETNLIGQASVPLNVALGMLKDGDGHIKLKIPLRGDVRDPSFGVEYILGLVIKKAVMNQAKDYLITNFVPYAQVVKVAIAAGSFALKVRFDDLPYALAQTEPGPEQEEFMQQLFALMADKKDLHVKVCPVVTPAELSAQEPVPEAEQEDYLRGLAKLRGDLFKAALVARGELESSRLLVCSPRIDYSDGAQARIEFSI